MLVHWVLQLAVLPALHFAPTSPHRTPPGRSAEPLPALRDVPTGEKQALFVRKLHLCAFSFDFTDPTAHVREKEVKRQTLLELVDYVNSGSGKFNEQVGSATGRLVATIADCCRPSNEQPPAGVVAGPARCAGAQAATLQRQRQA